MSYDDVTLFAVDLGNPSESVIGQGLAYPKGKPVFNAFKIIIPPRLLGTLIRQSAIHTLLFGSGLAFCLRRQYVKRVLAFPLICEWRSWMLNPLAINEGSFEGAFTVTRKTHRK